MRSEEDVIAQILHIATTDDRIRAVLLTGSRANSKVTRERFQDFDIIFIVTQLDTFVKDKHWIDVFGKRIIMQLPEEMTIGEKDKHAYHYLMLFKDTNRIDLTLFPVEKVKTMFKRESLATLVLDKDNLFKNLPSPTDIDYLIKQPTNKEFADCCNEFWWVSTYIAKGLWRNEVTYAKEMMDIPVRTMFLKIIEWYIGTKTAFTVPFGKGGRNMPQYLSPDLYRKILATYPDSSTKNIWSALFLMTQIFDEMAKEIAMSLNFPYNSEEANDVIAYLKRIYSEQPRTNKN